MTPFDDTRFDELCVEFTQLDQAAPSPLGMPAFESINRDNLATFFASYNDFESVTIPGFTGKRVAAYHEFKDIAVHVKHLAKAFAPGDADDSYFEQCPKEFDRQALKAFCKLMNDISAAKLCQAI